MLITIYTIPALLLVIFCHPGLDMRNLGINHLLHTLVGPAIGEKEVRAVDAVRDHQDWCRWS